MSVVKSIGEQLRTIHPSNLDFLILFVTGRCNARCQHCFYWRNLGPEHYGLSIDQVERLAQTMPPFRTLLLSGGEPSLRDDLAELVAVFRALNHVEYVSVPTNGLLPRRIAAQADEIAGAHPGVQVSVNVSLDGFAETHDGIRGVPGAYDKALQTLKLLARLKSRRSNLVTVVNSVILRSNHDQLTSFAEFLRGTGWLDGHEFEVVRGLPRDRSMRLLPEGILEGLHRELAVIQESYLVKSASARSWWLAPWSRVAKVGGLLARYDLQRRVLDSGGRWPFPCMAGESIAVVDYDGSLRVCELRDKRVSLADYGYDYELARASESMLRERQAARSHTCDCTHICFLGHSMNSSPFSRFVRVPLRYLRYKGLGR